MKLVKATLFIVCSLLLPGLLCANELLTIKATDSKGDLLENVVISAHPQTEQNNTAVSANKIIVIDQIDKEFIMHITAIQIGTRIDFPNHDQIHHHVYSFSQAKSFDIPLYKGSPENLIMFDKIGVVSLGCNIHDWMSAYIYVLDTAYFSTTNKKGVAFLELPPGAYEIRYWHPNIDEKNNNMSKLINISLGSNQTTSVQLGLKKVWILRRGPLSSFNRGLYR